MLKTSIKDPSIAIKPSAKLIDFIKTLNDTSIDLPENLLNVYRTFTKDNQKRNIYTRPFSSINYTEHEKELLNKLQKDSVKNDELDSCLRSLSLNVANDDDDDDNNSPSDIESLSAHESIGKNKARQNRAKQRQKELGKLQLNLTDLRWLHQHLNDARKNNETIEYLHELLEGSQLILPKNVMVERNPELEARCQRLKREQEEQTYRMMTKNVDCVRTHAPEDTIAYQVKQINRQLIAVLQFIFSVAACFAAGFMSTSGYDFGFRLLVGIICGLVVALAEMYFLAKKLNEEMDEVEQAQSIPPKNPIEKSTSDKKEHAD